MRTIRTWIPLLAGLFLVVGAPARAQEGLDEFTMKAYGGTYTLDCANPAAPRLTVFENALVLIEGDHRLAAGKVQAAAAWFGNDPPPDYRVALLGELAGARQLVVVVYEDATGPFLQIEGEARDLAPFSKAIPTAKFRRCGAPAKKAVAPAATAPSVAPAATTDAPAMMADKKFRAAYARALGARMRERWLALLDGPSGATRKVTIAGVDYVVVTSCKNHECDEHSLVLLYSAARKVVYGTIHDAGRASLIGAPPPAVAQELEKLWTAEWRATP